MASSEGRREVLDSEDEPMTSSPVDVPDGAADKLCATARAPPQDTQGAPKEAIRHLQAPADADANVIAKRIDGLDADRIDASIDVDSPEHGVTNTQLDDSTSSQGFPREADHSSCVPHSNSALHAKPATDVTPSEQEAVPPKIVGDDPMDADCEMTSVPDAEITTFTDDTMRDPESTNHGHRAEVTSEHGQARSVGVHEAKLAPSVAVEEAASCRGSNDDCINERNRAKTALCEDFNEPVGSRDENKGTGAQHESTSSSDDAAFDGVSHAVVQGPDLQTPHDASSERNVAENTVCVPMQDVDGRTHVDNGSAGANNESNVETTSESTDVATDTAPKPIDAESQSTMKDETSTRNVDISIVSSASSPAADTAHTMGEPLVSTANDAATRTSKSEAISTLEPPVTASSRVDSDSPSSNSPRATATAEVPLVARTPQEITLAELKAQKAAMLASLAVLPAIQVLMEETATSIAGMSGDEDEPTEADVMAAANKIVKDHIKLLHEYNELKDVGQGLMGLIADQRGVRIVEVQEEFGIEAND